jgi:hypothetical protein
MPHLMFTRRTSPTKTSAPFRISAIAKACPFFDRQGRSSTNRPVYRQTAAEQSYMIQLIGAAEKAKILADEKALLDQLCAYRGVLCLPHEKH